jgi:hypothetical protein
MRLAYTACIFFTPTKQKMELVIDTLLVFSFIAYGATLLSRTGFGAFGEVGAVSPKLF